MKNYLPKLNTFVFIAMKLSSCLITFAQIQMIKIL